MLLTVLSTGAIDMSARKQGDNGQLSASGTISGLSIKLLTKPLQYLA